MFSCSFSMLLFAKLVGFCEFLSRICVKREISEMWLFFTPPLRHKNHPWMRMGRRVSHQRVVPWAVCGGYDYTSRKSYLLEEVLQLLLSQRRRQQTPSSCGGFALPRDPPVCKPKWVITEFK